MYHDPTAPARTNGRLRHHDALLDHTPWSAAGHLVFAWKTRLHGTVGHWAYEGGYRPDQVGR